jgi:aryl-alcohol dehydrogenase-like predicted oxidoreductase
MRYTTLGRTGLRVSCVGLGCGGPSRLGQSQGQSTDASKAVIFRALELGINFFDTAESYDTELLLGTALAEARAGDNVLVSTKKGVWDWSKKQLCTPGEMREGLEASLRRLGRERIDVFHLHGLDLSHVDYAFSEIMPVLRSAQVAGKIGHLAVSEAFMSDTRHQMLQRVLEDDVFDVMMVGFNLLNASARRSVFPVTRELGVGTLVMFAVRRALTNSERLRELIGALIAKGELSPDAVDREHPLGFLGDVRDAGYRFCAHEPGADVVLTGTGSVEHLEQNVQSLLDVPLDSAQRRQIELIFGGIDSISGD